MRTCVLIALLAGAKSAPSSTLDDRLEAFGTSATSQNEEAVAQLLKAGVAEQRSAEALATVQPWLSRNLVRSPQALFYAGRATEFAGEWETAVGYYQRLLQIDGVDRRFAGIAVDATYRLLVSAIQDKNGAYLFMRKEGNRIREYGNARKYDRWFLDEAKQRRDLVAVCDRLAAIMNDRLTDDARFGTYLEWVCGEYEQFKKESPEAYEAALRLAAADAPAVYRARLKWVATVMPYNFSLDQLREANAPADPKMTDAPWAAAAELMQRAPDRGPFLVAQGWGVEYDHHHSGNCAKRFGVEQDRKLAQLLAALPKMSDERRDDMLAMPIAQGRVGFAPAEIRRIVIEHPGMLNALTVADVPLFDKTITVDEAKQLAPHLTRNPHAQAALVRAWAAPDRKYSIVADQMMNSEMWRFDDIKALTHGLWHSGMFERDVDYDVPIDKYRELDDRYQQLEKKIAKDASTSDRLAALDKIYNDLLSANPSIPAALPLYDRVFTQAPDADKVHLLKSLVANLQGEREYLLRRAVGKVRFGPKNNGALRWEADIYDNHFRYHQRATRDVAAELITHLGERVKSQMKSGRLNETIFGMWLHAVDRNEPDARAFMAELSRSPAFARLDYAYRRAAADHHHFGHLAVAPVDGETHPHYVNRELLALPEGAAQAQVSAALKTVVDRAAQAPIPLAVIGLHQVATLPALDAETRTLAWSLFGDAAPLHYESKQGYEQLGQRLVADLQTSGDYHAVEPYVIGLMLAAAVPDDGRQHRLGVALAKFAKAAREADAPSPALAIARSGMKVLSGSEHDLPALITRYRSISGKTSIALGIIDVPVDELDPAYPIYKSQAEFALGNLETAWSLFDKHAELLLAADQSSIRGDAEEESLIRKLTVDYCLWLLDTAVEKRETDRAEALVKELLIWSRRDAAAFTAAQEADLKISYADTAFQRGNYQTARAWYSRVTDAAEYAGTELKYKAALRLVRVDRASKNYDSALAELDKLMLIRNDSLRTRVHFAKAEVLFDQERYADAFEEVNAVLKKEPNHPDGLILLGKAQLEMRKLVDAAEIELGATRDQGAIVPGETIKINLNDPSLNVAGVGADIEVEIWSESGDRERVMLYQLGDDKSKYRAEVPTELAPPRPGDKTLQLLGNDAIRYGYSKAFRAKMADLPPDPQTVIGVASNARLDISAGGFPAREGARRLDLAELGVSTAQQALGTRNVRPGNPIYLRVFDPDQSTTPQADEIFVSLSAGSGDVISRLALKETGTHTGVFQAIIPTRTAQPTAYASEAAPNRDPNMVISDQPYPGWSGDIGSKAEDQTFTVDLNDNVPLNKMTVRCNDPGLAPTHFVLQTSLNGRDWETRARYPEDPAPWDGRPQLTCFPTYGRAISVSKLEDRSVPEDWLHAMEIGSAREDIPYAAATVPELKELQPGVASGGHPGYPALVRYRALFYQPAAAIRTFRLAGLPPAEGTSTVFLLNGKPAGEDSDDPLTITRELRPGLHEIQFWRNESRAQLEKRTPQILCSPEGGPATSVEADKLVPCPPSMFDPSTFPRAIREQTAQPATITMQEEGPAFEIAFGEHSQARMVRLVIVGHAGAAPALHKITLTDREGNRRLPVPIDYQQLRNNSQLEVVPGDQISVVYEDPKVISVGDPRRKSGRYEGRLGVAFNTAAISASFLRYQLNSEGDRELVLEDIRRFKMDDAVGIVINDPDMDTSADRDQIDFTVVTGDQPPQAFVALETEPHSGLFIGKVFPVETAPSRVSEIRVAPGGTLTAVYRDMENLDPGIPTDRAVTIEHARFATPSLGVYHATTSLLPQATQDEDAQEEEDDKNGPEIILPRRRLNDHYRTAQEVSADAPQSLIGAYLRFDVVVPHLAFGNSSTIAAYVQTEAGRKAHGDQDAKARGDQDAKARGDQRAVEAFDVRVPGTLKITGQIAGFSESRGRSGADYQSPPGYVSGVAANPPTNMPRLDEGRFIFRIPLVLGDLPPRSYATSAAESLPSSQVPHELAVQPNDRVYIGFAYQDESGKPQWRTAEVTLFADAFLDVMDGRFRRNMRSAFVGEKLFVRLMDPMLDKSPQRDSATVRLKTAGGADTKLELRETEPHSGHFKGSFPLTYASEPLGESLPAVEIRGLPVKYGDEITFSYGSPPLVQRVTVNKGADGIVAPFSKRYADDGMAVKTTFTLAECFFELAKHHRKLDQESLARREMSHAQKLLAEAIASHNDDELRARAEYLLGNLAHEYADLSKNDASKQLMYQDALARFSKIPLEYPDTEFAPLSQFKKALVYEKLGELDIAVEEYVKLAYKYPEHELIPSVMSRLGAHFQSQGLAYKRQAEALEKKEDNVEAAGEALRYRELATAEYLNAATVFGKLHSRFPNDKLAGLAGLRSAQNYMRAGDLEAAIVAFKVVADNEEYDDRTVRSQAMYWSGLSHERLGNTTQAYQTYRRVTFDFPDSVWAKYSRGRLADPVFAKIIDIENKTRERLLENLKKSR